MMDFWLGHGYRLPGPKGQMFCLNRVQLNGGLLAEENVQQHIGSAPA